MDLLVAFITGLTTGGLSCLAVQGGLLASSLAYQIEQDVQLQGASKKLRPRIAQPIFLFVTAKLIAYTLLGFLLGALGSLLQLTPLMRAILLGAIGIFMIGNGLRMLKVHPIFRYFVIEPPSSLTRYMRRKSKNGASLATPLFLGAMTVFIPCGVTQAMMATAVGTGDPMQGMAIMFAFILGTTPVFFALSYLATRLGATIEKYFTRIIAIAVIFLGLVSIDSGLTLAGSPVSFARLSSITGVAVEPVSTQAPAVSSGNVLLITAKDDGYSPKVIHAAANTSLKLNIVTNNTTSCARSIVFPDLNVEKILPVSGQVSVDVPPQKQDFVMNYSCSMGMYTGQIMFDQAPAESSNTLTITAKDDGYVPKVIHAVANTSLKLNIVTNNTTSCARSIVFPDLNVEKILPVSGQVSVDVPAQTQGFVMNYSCSMGMYTGQIVFDQ